MNRQTNHYYEALKTQRVAENLVTERVRVGEKDLCIDLGCGKFPHGIDEFGNEYLHFDQHPDAKADVFCDLNLGIPLDDNCVREVYCSHFLEHVDDPEYFVAEVYRVCQPEARVRFVVPAWQHPLSYEVNHRHQITESFFAINWVFDALFTVEELRWEFDTDGLARAKLWFPNMEDEDCGRLLNGVRKQLWVTCRPKKIAPHETPGIDSSLFHGGYPV
jgi:SAM-dependent methyltransferase